MEERARILKMLEEGRINAEQAARLIEALGSRRPEPVSVPPFSLRRGWRRRPFRGLERIPEMVSEAISESTGLGHGGDGNGESRDFPGKRALQIKAVSGDIRVSVWNEQRIRVGFSSRLVKTELREDMVMVNSVSGDLVAQVPGDTRLELVTVSGDVLVSGAGGGLVVRSVSGSVRLAAVAGQVAIGTVSGDIEMEEVSGELTVSSRSGDIVVIPAGAISGSVVTKSGNIAVVLAPEPDLILDVVSGEGRGVEFDTKVPYEVLESIPGRQRVRFGQGRHSLTVRGEMGDIVVCGREEQERWCAQ